MSKILDTMSIKSYTWAVNKKKRRIIMNFKERQNWGMFAVTAFIFISFIRRVFSEFSKNGLEAFDDAKFWSEIIIKNVFLMVILIVFTLILLHILTAIFTAAKNEITKSDKSIDESIEEVFDDVDDEMGKLINLKSSLAGYFIVSFGFILSVAIVYFELPFGLVMVVMFSSFIFGNIVEFLIKIYLYNRGVVHG
jgi:hypothetical protein